MLIPRLRNAIVLASAAILAVIPAVAQLDHPGPAALIKLSQALPAYDVISIRINNSGTNSFSLEVSDSSNKISGTDVPVETLIEEAYDVRPDRIFGLSGPVNEAHFDVEAKVLPRPDGTPQKFTDQQLEAMTIPLLADRFHLRAHVETRTLPIYEMVAAHGGPKFKLSTEAATGRSLNMSSRDTDRVLNAKSARMEDLTEMLSNLVHRPVIDRTGLAGHADITLQWTSDEAADQGSNVLSIFTALEEQLGLKLVSSKGPVETLVIDHIEMPAAN